MSSSLLAIRREKVRRLRQEAYRRDPLLWLTERLGEPLESCVWSAYPGYEGHSWDADVDPLADAWRHIAEGRWVGVESATGTGKTYFLSRVVFWFLDCYEDSLVVTCAPKEDQLKLHLWAEITRAFHLFKRIRPHAVLDSLRLRPDGRPSESGEADLSNSWQAIGFIAGTGSEEESATKAQGFHRRHMLIITEETPGIRAAVMTAFQNTSVGEHNLILAVGNPDSESDQLHQFCKQQAVRSVRISAYDHPNVVLGRDLVPGAVTRTSIDRRRTEYGEASPMYLSRVRGISPVQGVDSLIRIEWFDQCVNLEIPASGYNACGVDVANSDSGDLAALAWGRGCHLVALESFQCPNATHLGYNLVMDSAELLRHGYDDYRTGKLSDYDVMGECVGVDAGGPGVATVNALRDHGHRVISLQGGQWEDAIPRDEPKPGQAEGDPLYDFSALRSQMYWELREDLRLRRISIRLPDSRTLHKLRSQLALPKFVATDKVIGLEKKEAIKARMGGKSPDLADAVAYWNWARKGYRMTRLGGLPILFGKPR